MIELKVARREGGTINGPRTTPASDCVTPVTTRARYALQLPKVHGETGQERLTGRIHDVHSLPHAGVADTMGMKSEKGGDCG